MTTLTFQTTTLSVINQNNQTYFTANEIGQALGYRNPTSDVKRIYERNIDEFTPCMTALVDMQTAGGIQKVRIFSLRGCHLIGMLSHTKVAKAFRKWVLDILDAEIAKNQTALPAPTTLTPEEQYMVQNAVKATHEKTGLSYGEIWARTKNKFKVAKYEQIERSQLNEVLTYITSPEPKPRGILLDEEAFYVVAKAIAKLNESTFEWEKMMDLFSELESHRNYKTAFNLGVASYNLAQSSEKIIMKNLVQMKNKVWKKEIEDFIFSNPHLQNHTENKLVHYLR